MRFLSNIFIALGALLLALLLAEICSRWLLPPPQVVQTSIKQAPASQNTLADKQSISLEAHPDEGGVYKGTPTGRRLQPNRLVTINNHQLSGKTVTITTNSMGYRNPEPGPKQGTRILFLGDSITFQDYLPESETFVRKIEEKAKAEKFNWQTINAGVGAVSLKTELAILLETGLSLKPDVVVLGFYLNDYKESKGVKIVQLPWLMKNSWFAYHLSHWAQLMFGQLMDDPELSRLDLEKWKQAYIANNEFAAGRFNESPQSFNQMVLDHFDNYGASWSDGAWQYMTPLFTEFVRLSKEHNFKLIIVSFPIYQQVYTEFIDSRPQQQLYRLATEFEVPLLDMLPLLRAEAYHLGGPSIYHGDTIYGDLFYDHCHHTELGSELIANSIFEFFKLELN